MEESKMGREILIADPDLTDQREFQNIFESTDYRLVFSENSEEAFFSIRLLKPDLVIAGLALAEKTGVELCEVVKKDPELNHIPFVLLSGIFEDIPEEEQRRVGANGVLSKPLVGEEVLTLVDRLLTKEAVMAKKEEAADRGTEWKSFADMNEGDLSLGSPEEMDEEIIELVDVVEEPEPRMSIDNFVSAPREEPGAEIPSIEPWARSFEEETGGVTAGEKPEEEKPGEEELLSGLEQRAQEAEEPPPPPLTKGGTPEEELFEKIELEEILEKVEMLKPALEKEWPSEKGEPKEAKRAEPVSPGIGPAFVKDWSSEAPEEKAEVSVEGASTVEEEKKKPMGFDEFEALLRKDLGIGSVEEEGLQPLSLEETKAEPEGEISAEKEHVTREELEGLAEEVAALESKPGPIEQAPEKLTELHELEALLKKGIEPEPAPEEGLEPFPFEEAKGEVSEKATSIEPPLEEELPELKEEEFRESLLEEMEEELEEEILEEGEVGAVEELREEELDVLKEIEPLEMAAEEAAISSEVMAEELAAPGEVRAKEITVPFEEMKKVILPPEEPREVTAPAEKVKEAVTPLVRFADKQLQEVIANGIQVMIGDFITKILPEMTQNILDLTAERIEKMVKEIVPELAEKAIQEEIKRLQKGEKE